MYLTLAHFMVGIAEKCFSMALKNDPRKMKMRFSICTRTCETLGCLKIVPGVHVQDKFSRYESIAEKRFHIPLKNDRRKTI